MTNSVSASKQGGTAAGAATLYKPLANTVKGGEQAGASLPGRIIGLANAAARSLPDSAIAAKPAPKNETTANANANQNDKAPKNTEANNASQFTVDWNLNKPEGNDKLGKAVIGNS